MTPPIRNLPLVTPTYLIGLDILVYVSFNNFYKRSFEHDLRIFLEKYLKRVLSTCISKLMQVCLKN